MEFDQKEVIEYRLKEALKYSPKRENEKILFWVSVYSYFLESVESLINTYVKKGIQCGILFMDVEYMISETGTGASEIMLTVIERLKNKGVRCILYRDWNPSEGKWDVCYVNKGGKIPEKIRGACRYIALLQLMAHYTHTLKGNYFQENQSFENLFGEAVLRNIDYVIVAEHIADWIENISSDFKEKILRFGYPKQDDLYNAMNKKSEIPEEWQHKIQNKKVYLWTFSNLRCLPESLKSDDRIVIFRPHPLRLEEILKNEIENIKKQKNLILDNRTTYWASFQASDVMISCMGASMCSNYLMAGKTCLLVGDQDKEEDALGNKSQVWYKASYIVHDFDEIDSFVEKYEAGKLGNTEEKEKNRGILKKQFDGKVCERIVNFFESKLKE